MAIAAPDVCPRCRTAHCRNASRHRHPPAKQDPAATALLIVVALLVLGAGTPAARTAVAPAARKAVEAVAPIPKPVTPQASGVWSAVAKQDIPGIYQHHYRKAATTCRNLTPHLLAGIGKVETNHGRLDLPGVNSGLNRYKDSKGRWRSCCAGPMQFNLVNGRGGRPSTWAAYKAPGDTRQDVYRPERAIPAAARLLCANGVADGRIRDAVWNYNHSSAYIDEVLAWAARYRGKAA